MQNPAAPGSWLVYSTAESSTQYDPRDGSVLAHKTTVTSLDQASGEPISQCSLLDNATPIQTSPGSSASTLSSGRREPSGLIDWMHTWTFIGLGDYLTICSNSFAIPASCSFSLQAGYIVNAIVTTNFFILLMATVWAWKSQRNLVVIGSILTKVVLALSTLLTHMHPDELIIGLILCVGALVLAAIWTSVARREFAVVGENNLGCLGMWLIVGTCLFIYLGAFAFFSIPGFRETETNIPFASGLTIPAPGGIGIADAIAVLVLMGILAGIQFFFLIRNRYKV